MKSKRHQEQSVRLKKVYPTILTLDRNKCRAFWVQDTGNFLNDKLEVMHIIGRDVRHPEYDDPKNLMLVKKIIHDWCDGRQKNPLGISHKHYLVYILEKLKRVHLDEFRWEESYQYLKRKLKPLAKEVSVVDTIKK